MTNLLAHINNWLYDERGQINLRRQQPAGGYRIGGHHHRLHRYCLGQRGR